MARTDTAHRLTVAYRAQQLAARAGSVRDLVKLWKAVDPTNLRDTIDVFSHAAAILAGRGYERSAAQGAEYFSLFRRAEGVRGPGPQVRMATGPGQSKVQGLIRGAALTGIINARRAGLPPRPSADNGLVKAIGTFTKLILAGGNNTIIGAVHDDPAATGWVRVTSADACPFCRLLSSRGAVYRSDRSASFEPHDNCACTAEPVYGDQPLKQSAQHFAEYRTAQAWARSTGNLSKGTSNDSLNNYRRWLEAGQSTEGSGQ